MMQDPEIPRHVELIWDLTRWIHERRSRALAAVSGFLITVVLLSGLTTVPNGQAGLLRRFGRVRPEPVSPGAVYVLPAIERLEKVAVGNERKLDLSRRDGSPLELITADENLVSVRMQIQYRVEDPIALVTRHRDAETVLRNAAVAALTRRTAAERVENVLTAGKVHLQELVRQDLQQECEKLDLGLRLVGVSVVAAGPPVGAEDAFTAVSSAAAERERRVSEADGKRAEAMALARAEAERKRREAESFRGEAIEVARGFSERFRVLVKEVAPERRAALTRLHRETLERVVHAARLVVLPPGRKTETIRSLLDVPTAVSPPSAPPGATRPKSGQELAKEMALPPILPEDVIRGELPKGGGSNPKRP